MTFEVRTSHYFQTQFNAARLNTSITTRNLVRICSAGLAVGRMALFMQRHFFFSTVQLRRGQGRLTSFAYLLIRFPYHLLLPFLIPYFSLLPTFHRFLSFIFPISFSPRHFLRSQSSLFVITFSTFLFTRPIPSPLLNPISIISYYYTFYFLLSS